VQGVAVERRECGEITSGNEDECRLHDGPPLIDDACSQR
jgi:hypothetical protein